MHDTQHILKVNDINSLNLSDDFLVYNKNQRKNVLVLGACRMTSFAYYLSVLPNFNYNIYMIYIIPFMLNNTLPNYQTINRILESTDIIICENIVNHVGLNTSDNSNGKTFFETFGVQDNVKIFKIPPIELRYFFHTNYHIFEQSFDNMESYINSSKQLLYERLDKLNFNKTKDFIKNNIEKYRLFHNHNHPTSTLLVCLFAELCEKMNVKIPAEYISQLLIHNFLGGNDTPIFNPDVICNNFKYKNNISSCYDFMIKDLFVTNLPPTNAEIVEQANAIIALYEL
jgi:hypothetical protein